MKKPLTVDQAYALNGPQDIKKLYQDWAASYDSGFGEAEGYQLPREVALAFIGAGGKGPVLDVGVGTGLVGETLVRSGVGPLDGVDLSMQMLNIAAGKAIYRDLIEADILHPPATLNGYRGIVSAGTFTLGHVGPEGLDGLLSLAMPGALFVISVNARHYVEAGFEARIALLDTEIRDLTFRDVRIYDDRASSSHSDDMARLIIFRKA